MKRKIAAFLAVCTVCGRMSSVPVFAEQGTANRTNTTILTEEQEQYGKDFDLATLEDTEAYSSVTKQSGDVAFQVKWPETIQCGTPTEFQFSTDGGSGTYKYRVATLNVEDDGMYKPVYDVSVGQNGAFKEDNTFSFTFEASGTYQLRFGCMDMGTYKTLQTEYVLITVDDPAYPSTDEIAQRLAEECEKECTTDYEKAVWFHDWLMTNSVYDHSFTYCSAEGVMARGKGTCESFTTAYSKMLNAVGIPNNRSTGNYHTWSVVQLDGKWYQIDTTWDNTGYSSLDDFQSHLYFGLTDELILKVHDEHKPSTERVCDSLEDNYFIRSGKITAWTDPFMNDIQQNLDAGQKSFDLSTDGTFPGMEYQNPPTSYKNIMYALAAYYLENKTEWTQNGHSVLLGVQYDRDKLTFTVTDKECITFDVNGGKELSTGFKDLILNDIYGTLPVPVKEGYTFDGWYTSLEGGDKVTEETVCTKSTTVYAHWSAIPTPTPTPTPEVKPEPVGTWESSGENWYYRVEGKVKTGWFQDRETWYYANANGVMQRGWLKWNGNWYFLKSSGAMATGWLKDAGIWYYMDPTSGAMRTGWVSDEGEWYFLYGNGAMATGWIKLGNTWYYLKSSGKMATGWVLSGGQWYFMYDSGKMATGWVKDGNTWYYLYGSGAMASNTWVGNYYLQSDGSMAVDKWIGSWYVGSDGAWDSTKTR